MRRVAPQRCPIYAAIILSSNFRMIIPFTLKNIHTPVFNFQNYQKCKLAYNKAYQIRFGDLGLQSSTLEKINKFIIYRHRIIHVSALLGMLNQAEVPPEEPVFPKKELASEAIREFDNFIERLHEATLKLRRKD